MSRWVIFLAETLGFGQGVVAGRKMDTAARLKATLDHAYIPPVKPAFIGVFYWQISLC
jgi:hypothetical protein